MRDVGTLRQIVMNLLEPVTRSLGLLGPLFGRSRFGLEMVIRGWILGGTQRWRIGRRVEFDGAAIRMGRNVVLYGDNWLDASGDRGHISIGNATRIDRQTILYGQGGLTVGADCAVASGVHIYSQTNQDLLRDGTPASKQPTKYAPVIIEDGCWIGTGATVLPGVTVQRCARIGAGAVVTSSVGPMLTAVGVPARTKQSEATERTIE